MPALTTAQPTSRLYSRMQMALLLAAGIGLDAIAHATGSSLDRLRRILGRRGLAGFVQGLVALGRLTAETGRARLAARCATLLDQAIDQAHPGVEAYFAWCTLARRDPVAHIAAMALRLVARVGRASLDPPARRPGRTPRPAAPPTPEQGLARAASRFAVELRDTAILLESSQADQAEPGPPLADGTGARVEPLATNAGALEGSEPLALPAPAPTSSESPALASEPEPDLLPVEPASPEPQVAADTPPCADDDDDEDWRDTVSIRIDTIPGAPLDDPARPASPEPELVDEAYALACVDAAIEYRMHQPPDPRFRDGLRHDLVRLAGSRWPTPVALGQAIAAGRWWPPPAPLRLHGWSHPRSMPPAWRPKPA